MGSRRERQADRRPDGIRSRKAAASLGDVGPTDPGRAAVHRSSAGVEIADQSVTTGPAQSVTPEQQPRKDEIMSIQQLDARLVLHQALAEGALRRGDRVSVTVHERAAASLSKISCGYRRRRRGCRLALSRPELQQLTSYRTARIVCGRFGRGA